MELPEEVIAATERLATVAAQYQHGEFDAVLAAGDEILGAFNANGITAGWAPAYVLHLRALSLVELGKPEAAMDALGRAVAALGMPGGELDDPKLRGHLLTTTGKALRMRGDYRLAREAYEMAIPLLRGERGEALSAALNSFGALVSHLGDTARALALYEEAREAMEGVEAGDHQRAAVLLNLGGARQDAGELSAALGSLEEALPLFWACGDRVNVAQVQRSLSELHKAAGDAARARALAAEAVATARKASPRSELYARCLYQRETLAAAAGAPSSKVLPGLRECVETISAVAPRGRAASDMRSRLAVHLIGAGEVEEGIEVASSAVEIAEQLRSAAGPGLGGQQIAAASALAYETLAFALLWSDSPAHRERLVKTLERRRGRWLLDALGKSGGSDDERSRRLRAARAEARRALQQAHRATAGLAAGEAVPDWVDAEALERIEARARHQIEVVDAELGGGDEIAILGAAEIQARLSPRQVVLHCFVTPMISAAITIAADELTVRELAVEMPWLEQAVAELGTAAAEGSTVEESAMRTLARELLGDLPDQAEELIVICDGPLHWLPWGILPDRSRGERPLGTTRSISHAISMTTDAALTDGARPDHDGDLLLVGDPAYTAEQFPNPRQRRLVGTEKELAAIAALNPEHTALTGDDATEARVLAELPRHRRAHFACHGAGNDRSAAFGGLVLAPPRPSDEVLLANTDDILEAWEIDELALACDTVVLASCSTAGGELLRGEGLVGLAHAFHRAGARQVLAALWPVDDDATARFMTSLYGFLGEGEPLARALRLARAALATERPAHWAPWIAFGPSS